MDTPFQVRAETPLTVASHDTRETGSREAPESRLEELARAGGPLRRTLAALAGRMVASRGWERLGYARPGDYARERLGLSARTLQEWARVDGGLAALPRLETALVSGGLPWSKVRLLARFVTPQDEGRWIAHAAQRGVRMLERDVRAVDRGALESGGLVLDEEGGDIEVSEHVRIPASPALCLGWQRVRRYAAKVSGEELTPGAVLEMVTAETFSALPLDAPAQEDLASGDAEALPADGVEFPARSAARGGNALGPGREPSDAAPDPALRFPCPSDVAATGPPDVGRASGGCGETPAAARSAADDAVRIACPAAPEGNLPTPDAPRQDPRRRTDLPPFLHSLWEGLAEADAFELDARLRRAVRLEQRLDAAIGPLLRQVSSGEYRWRERYQTLAAYAREHLGMSPRKARALVRLERAGDLCPALRGAYRDGALSWVQAQVLIPLLARDDTRDTPWRGAWVAFAARVTVRRLTELVDEALTLKEVDPESWSRVQAEPERLARKLRGEEAGEWQVCAHPRVSERGLTLRITAPADVARLFRAVSCTLRRAIERETGSLPDPGEAFEAMLAHALRSWGVDEPWLARWSKRVSPVFARDDLRCTVPGCSSRRNLHAHHIVFRSAGGGDEPENLTTLCAFHHQRGVHGGLVTVRGRAPEHLVFAIGLRPGLPPLARYRSGDRVA